MYIQIYANTVYFSLHPTARCTGNVISIPRVPLSTFYIIEYLIEQTELESVCHWKLSFDLERPPLNNQNFQYCEGTLSCKMLSTTHESLAHFAAVLQAEMWNMGSQHSFYPPEDRSNQYFITSTRSAGMIPVLVFVCTQFVIKAANICCTYLYKRNRYRAQTRWSPQIDKTTRREPKISRGRLSVSGP